MAKAKTATVKVVVAIDETGEWAVAPVRGSRSEAVADALAELASDQYAEVLELVLPLPVPARPVRTVRIEPAALAVVHAEPAADEEEEAETAEVAG